MIRSPVFMFHVNMRTIVTYTCPHRRCCSEWPAPRGSCEFLVLKKTRSGQTALHKEKHSPYQGLREADQVHRCPREGQWEESFSESIPSYQVEKDHVNYTGFKVLKSSAIESFCSKDFILKAYFNMVQEAISRWSFEDTVLPWIFILSLSLVQNIKT